MKIIKMKKENIKILKEGGIGVVMTDTIYGVLGSAFKPKTVEKIYILRKRDKKKPFIILISSKKDLQKFGIKINKDIRKILDKYWPGKVSVILPSPSSKFNYLHRGKKTLAFRLPKNKKLKDILKKTGPLVAPSANLEGKSPAKNIKEAKIYFAKKVDFYESGKKSNSNPSKIIIIKNGKELVLRK